MSITAETEKFFKQDNSSAIDEMLFHFVHLSNERLAKSFEVFYKESYGWSPNVTNVLCYLKLYEKVSMSGLADLTNSSRQHMTQIVDTLCNKNLTERVYDSSNRRAVYVKASEHGLKLLNEGEAKFVGYIHDSIDKLPSEEQTDILESIRKTSEFLAALPLNPKELSKA